MAKHIFITLLIILTTGIAAGRPVVKKPNHVTREAFTTESYLIANSDGIILSEHNSELQRPIASISKLMVGMLASVQDLDERLIIPVNRTVQSSIPFKQPTLTRRELLTLALVKSDNLAAQILCNNILNCIEEMNFTALGIGMIHTHFSEPTGLSIENISTASDLLKLMLVVSSNYTITSLSSMPSAVIPVNKGVIHIQNTNSLTSKLDIFLSKTGFTNPAGGCLIMAVNSPVGQRFIVLLGSRNAKTRIPDMEKLYKELI
jgi:serine-type D-Ala-D-Ala endopeptidase (penicillin-binding protein 7)